jgi:hypothetical protein
MCVQSGAKPMLTNVYFFDKIVLLFKNLLIFITTEWKFLKRFDEVLCNNQISLFLINVSLSIKI